MPQIPAGWEETTLGKACIVMSWSTPSTKEELYRDWDISWITPKDLSNYNERYIAEGERNITEAWVKNSSAQILPPNTILFSSRAPIWYVAIAKKELTTNQGFKNIICDEKESHYLFFYYWLKYRSEYIEKISSGSTFTEASAAIMRSLPIHRPPLPEQQAIAAVLSSFDDKIELLRAENQTLEQMGQELFKERFGKWKVGDELPQGWRVGKLGKEIKFIKGKKPKAVSDSYKEGRIPQVLIETLDGWISLFADPEKSILLNSGEIVMVMDGASSGRCEIGFSWVLWSTLAKIEVNPSLKLMLYALLKNKFKEINGWTTGSSIPHTDKHKICDFDFIIPTKETLYDFNKLYWNLIEKILLNRKQIQTLSVTRDQLLPKLMSGEVRVEF